ncbi:PhoD-like phosphatase N-terminal domain-containing protein [Streptosporangium roseum]|uniref:PhoD-like phosphatase N-terminal domain-containing protein n=1 Tax=Streptosporangium roseum TaxID=2001 RepID=UPI003328FC81
MDDAPQLARALSDPSRRTFFGLTGSALALAFTTNLADPWTPRFDAGNGYPFQLGVASGDPLPDSVILWTRLAVRPLEPLGGMPYGRIKVDWEIAEDRSRSKSAPWQGVPE